MGASEYELAAASSTADQVLPMGRLAQAEKPRPMHPLVISDPLSARQVGEVAAPTSNAFLPGLLRAAPLH